MASAPLAIGKATPAAGIPNTAAEGSAVDKINSGNQVDSAPFPMLMKKIKEADDKQNPDGPAAPTAVSHIHVPDNVLPLPGTTLPPALPQGAMPGQGDAPTPGNEPLKVKDNGRPAINLPAGGLKADDLKIANKVYSDAAASKGKLPETVQDAQTAEAGKKDGAGSGSAAGAQADSPAKIDFNPSAPGARDAPNIAQNAVNNLSVDILNKHPGDVDLSHTVPGAAGVSPQGSEKVDQSTTAPAIPVPLKNPAWGDELSNRVMWMVHQDVQSASIKLNPPHLGPLEVNVSLTDNQVDVSFSSHHASVKEALDASMPKLREMLGDNGLQLGNTNVAHRSFSDQHQSNNNQTMNYRYEEGGDHNSNSANAGPSEIENGSYGYFSDGAIDIFA